jgi:hypothetical protein
MVGLQLRIASGPAELGRGNGDDAHLTAATTRTKQMHTPLGHAQRDFV